MSARRPALSVVRSGNPGHRPVPDHIAVPPADFAEPDWLVPFPGERTPVKPVIDDFGTEPEFLMAIEMWRLKKKAIEGARFARARASEEWRRVEPTLSRSVGLGAVDFTTLVEYCTVVARLEWCERQLSIEGLVVMGQRGTCRNPLTTVAAAYRTQLKTYIRELGLSPLARTGVPSKPEDDDESDPFD